MINAKHRIEKGETMNIPYPIANRGDAVMVHNYRSRKKDGSRTMERGHVVGLMYSNKFGFFNWKYDVLLDRKSRAGHPIRLYVSDDGIEK